MRAIELSSERYQGSVAVAHPFVGAELRLRKLQVWEPWHNWIVFHPVFFYNPWWVCPLVVCLISFWNHAFFWDNEFPAILTHCDKKQSFRFKADNRRTGGCDTRWWEQSFFIHLPQHNHDFVQTSVLFPFFPPRVCFLSSHSTFNPKLSRPLVTPIALGMVMFSLSALYFLN